MKDKDLKCECETTGRVAENMLIMYDSTTERPFVNHKPGKCECTNNLKKYIRNGKEVWLCSICTMFDIEVLK